MNEKDFEKIFWYFYIDIEEEFLEISKIIPIDSINSNTFSFKYARLLQAICSEIDMVFKRFMEFCSYDYKKGDIMTYETFIESKFNDFKNLTVTCYKTSHNYKTFKPFLNWTPDNVPIWWTVNNKLKHKRDELDKNGLENFKSANQETLLNALAGLFILLMYFYKQIVKTNSVANRLEVPLPQSEIFHLNNWGDYYKKIIANKFFVEIRDDGHLCVTAPDK